MRFAFAYGVANRDVCCQAHMQRVVHDPWADDNVVPIPSLQLLPSARPSGAGAGLHHQSEVPSVLNRLHDVAIHTPLVRFIGRISAILHLALSLLKRPLSVDFKGLILLVCATC